MTYEFLNEELLKITNEALIKKANAHKLAVRLKKSREPMTTDPEILKILMFAERELASPPFKNPYHSLFVGMHRNQGSRQSGQLYDDLDACEIRYRLVKEWSWAVPTSEAISMMVQYSPNGIVEIGAGTGYWASLFASVGGDILAYDEVPPTKDAGINTFHPFQDTYYPVKQGSPASCITHQNRTLFLCWPPYNTEMAHRTLRYYRGDTLIYVGEPAGGCCADDSFFELLQLDWTEVETLSLPKWPGIHDSMYVYHRTAA